MAATCTSFVCVCKRQEKCAALRHVPLVWTNSFGAASDWHVRKLETVKAMGKAANRNVILCGIELVIDGIQLHAPAIGNVPCIFVSGTPPNEGLMRDTLGHLADLHALGTRVVRYAYTGDIEARERIRGLLSGLVDAHVGAPETAANVVDYCTGCVTAVHDKGAHTEHDLLALTDASTILHSLNAALHCVNPAGEMAPAPRAIVKKKVTALRLHVASYRYTCGVCGLCYRAASFSPAPLLATAWRLLRGHKAVLDPLVSYITLGDVPRYDILVSAVKPYTREAHVAVPDSGESLAPATDHSSLVYTSQDTLLPFGSEVHSAESPSRPAGEAESHVSASAVESSTSRAALESRHVLPIGQATSPVFPASEPAALATMHER